MIHDKLHHGLKLRSDPRGGINFPASGDFARAPFHRRQILHTPSDPSYRPSSLFLNHIYSLIFLYVSCAICFVLPIPNCHEFNCSLSVQYSNLLCGLYRHWGIYFFRFLLRGSVWSRSSLPTCCLASLRATQVRAWQAFNILSVQLLVRDDISVSLTFF